jgi:hypothetical protein
MSDLVVMVSYSDFEDAIELISSQIGKPPAEGAAYDRWLENKFLLVKHLSATRWAEMVPVAFNSWRFWNEFTTQWVHECSAELARLEQSRQKPSPVVGISPCPAWLGVWLSHCREARATGKPEPKPREVQVKMLEHSLDPLAPSQSLNQLILQALGGNNTKAFEPEGLSPGQVRSAKREIEELWL